MPRSSRSRDQSRSVIDPAVAAHGGATEGLSIVLFAISAIVLFPLFLDLSGGQLVRPGIVNQNGDTYFDP
jgi:hypothetical protein